MAIEAYLVLVALLVGSFINLAADRVPRGESLPWASGVARRRGALVPILDLDALGDQIG